MVALLGTPGNGPKPVISTLVRARPPACRSPCGCIMLVTRRLRAMIGEPHQLHQLAYAQEPVCGGPGRTASSPMRLQKRQLPPDGGLAHQEFALPPATARAPQPPMRFLWSRVCTGATRLLSPRREGKRAQSIASRRGMASIAAHNSYRPTPARASFSGASVALLSAATNARTNSRPAGRKA
jgi:hypothetical protein